MITEIRLPQWGMGMREGTVLRWLKQEGDRVEEGDELVEIEAAKVTEVVAAPASGVLARVLVPEGQTIPVRTVLALIADRMEEVQGAAPSDSDAAPSPAQQPTAPAPSQAAPATRGAPTVQVTPVARRLAADLGVDLSRVQGTGPRGRITDEDVRRAAKAQEEERRQAARPPVQVEPRARRLAQEHGLDLSRITGSGPNGRITEADVRRALEATPAPSTGQTIALTGMRAAIARRMHESLQTMAQLTLTTEADVTDLVALRGELKAQSNVTYTDLIVKAVALALKEHPRLNATLDGDEIRLLPEIHVGVAVALDEGLIVPVVRNTDRKSLREISAEIARLAAGAREGSLKPDEVSGSTFTVTNLGMFDIDAFTPIINPPEVAILGVGRIRETLARRADGIAWRQVMTLSLTFDHRIIDGAPAAAFLQAVKARLEAPQALAD